MMTFANELWGKIQPVYNKIIKHPFLVELSSGLLPADKFAYYLEQDSEYLKVFARALAILAARLPDDAHFLALLAMAQETLTVESAEVHEHYMQQIPDLQLNSMKAQHVDFKESAGLRQSLVCGGYTSHIMQRCTSAPILEALSAVVPCFWIYHKVACHFVATTRDQHRYSAWFDAYVEPQFEKSVTKVIDIFNTYADGASEQDRVAAERTFVTSSMFEYSFWDDAYNAVKILVPSEELGKAS